MSELLDALAAATTPEERQAIKAAAYENQYASPPPGWEPSIIQSTRVTFIDSVTVMPNGLLRVEIRLEIAGEPVDLGDLAVLFVVNPPVLVDDPVGEVIRSWTDPDGNPQERRLHEDVLEALKQVVIDATKDVP